MCGYGYSCQVMLPLYQKVREVKVADAVKWLVESNEPFHGSVFTGIPDLYDVYGFRSTQEVGINQRADDYKEWFNQVAEAIFRRLPPGQCALFSQTDGKILDTEGRVICWLDKSVLLSNAATKYGCTLLWHKIAIDTSAEISSHRPCYTHLLAFGNQFTYHTRHFRTPDVFNRGQMTWEKATGINVCIIGISFLHYVVHTPVVINPFCGRGTILAIANCFGLSALGVEIATKRAKRAGQRDLRGDFLAIPVETLKVLGVRQDVLTLIDCSESTEVASEQAGDTGEGDEMWSSEMVGGEDEGGSGDEGSGDS